MNIPQVLFIVLLLVGAIQGIIYGIILLKDHGPNSSANKFLAIILFFFAYRLVAEIIQLFGFGRYDLWYHILIEFNWIYGALIYFFVRAYIIPNFKLNFKNHWIHFIPVLIEFFWSNFIKTQNFFWDGTRESLSWLGYWGYVLWMHYPTIYIIGAILVFAYTRESQKLIKKQSNNTQFIVTENIKWINKVIIILKYYSVLIFTVVVTDFLFFNYAFDRQYHYFIFIGMAIITYWLGLEGFSRRSKIVVKEKFRISKQENEKLTNLSLRMNRLMTTDQLFKDPKLSRDSLADALDVKPYEISRCLNIIFEKKFSDYVNYFRVEEIQKLRADPKKQNLTLLALAFEAGFNSKASFNRAVKKHTGKSPSEL